MRGFGRRPILAALLVFAIGAGALAYDAIGLGGTQAGPIAPAAAVESGPPAVAGGAVPASSTEPGLNPSPGIAAAVQPRPRPKHRPTTAAVQGSALQATLDRLRVSSRIPGISVTIRFLDGSVWTGTSGMADVRRGRPVTAGTAFAVASMSKTFLAALILQLVDEGRLRLDDRVARLLPERSVPAAVTVRQLLDHTSGIHDYFLGKGIDEALQSNRAARWTAARALRYVGKPYFKPGAGYHYSNTNYLLLGLLAEHVTGERLATSFRERFFEPLGLDSTYYQAVEKPRGATSHGYRVPATSTAKPVDLSDGTTIMPFTSVVTAAGGAGSVAATSVDVAAWAEALYSGRVLSPAASAMMVNAAFETALLPGGRTYGLGVQQVPIGRWQTVGHSGRFLGFQGAMRYLPDEGVTIALLTNQSRSEPGPIIQRLLETALPSSVSCRSCQ